MRKTLTIMMSLMLALILCGCGPKNKAFDPDEGLDRENVFFDDFEDGISPDNWAISRMKWGEGNGGVIPENVGYTEDGVVVITCNGDNYDGPKRGVGNDHGRRTGGKIESRKSFGPGRFEVRMKCLPRFGSTTAFWTYYHDGVNANHEIDIELNVEHDFTAVWNTNWLTVNDSFDHYVTRTDIVNNDGDWHVYKFEWHTDPERIDYYIDDILTHTSYSNIPTYGSPINIGNWFPSGWAGAPDFETDYTLVDWFRYTPYLNNPYDPTPGPAASPEGDYPAEPMELPLANLISNGGFEGRAEAWKKKRPTQTSAVIEGAGRGGSAGMNVTSGETVHQYITGAHNGFEYKITGSAKASGTGGYLLIQSMPLYEKEIESFRIDFAAGESFTEKELTFRLTKDAQQLKVCLVANEGGSIVFDDLFMNTTKILGQHASAI